VFATLAALGAGLEVGVEAIAHHIEASPLLVAYAVATPVGVYLLLLLAIFRPFADDPVIAPAHLLAGTVVALLLPLTTTWWSATTTIALIAAVTTVLVAVTVARPQAATVTT
jgi:hypothetical protein